MRPLSFVTFVTRSTFVNVGKVPCRPKANPSMPGCVSHERLHCQYLSLSMTPLPKAHSLSYRKPLTSPLLAKIETQSAHFDTNGPARASPYEAQATFVFCHYTMFPYLLVHASAVHTEGWGSRGIAPPRTVHQRDEVSM